MNINSILSKYIIKRFAFDLIVIISILSLILILSSILEINRVTQNKIIDNITYIKLVLYKIPFLIEKIIAFIFLITAIYVFFNMKKSTELIALRASSISIWQLIMPIIIFSFLSGIFWFLFINPISSVLINEFDHLSNKYIKTSNKDLSWIIDKSAEKIYIISFKSSDEYKIMNTVFYIFDNDKNFIERIESDEVILENNIWLLKNVSINSDKGLNRYIKEYKLNSSTKWNQIKNNYTSAESISFWRLPNYINLLNKIGIKNTKYKMYLCKLIMMPLYFSSMIILAGCICLRSYNRQDNNMLIIILFIIGFIIYFINDVIYSFGLSGKIPYLASVIAPTSIIYFISSYLLTNIEHE